MGWPPWLVPEDCAPPCENDRDGWGGVDDCTVGLNVTVRCGFAGSCCFAFASDEIRGVVSVELDAIVMDPCRSDCFCYNGFLTSSTLHYSYGMSQW